MPTRVPPATPVGGTATVGPARGLPDSGDALRQFRDAFAVVVLPTLNEELGLARTLEELAEHRTAGPNSGVPVLVIDGGSLDGTLGIAERWGIPALHQRSRGKGAAILEAIESLRQVGSRNIVVMDADASYPTDRVGPTIDLLRGGADLVFGVRRPVWGAPRTAEELVHRFGNVALSYTASLLARRTILDLCSGFWAISLDRFAELGITTAGFAIEAELILKAIRRGFRVSQIPIDYRARLGVAKLHALRDGAHILHQTLREARAGGSPSPSEPGPRSWGQDVLSIALSAGRSTAFVECRQDQTVIARRVVAALRDTMPGSQLMVDPAPSPPVSGAVGDRGDFVRAESLPSSLVVSLASAGSPSGIVRSVTVSIRSRERQLTIELPPEAPATGESIAESGDSESGAWARAGGAMALPRSRARIRSSLPIITSRLNYDWASQQRMILQANGFVAVEAPRAPPNRPPPSSPPSAPLAG